MNPFAIIAILLIIAGASFIFYNIHRIKKNGIETDAVITRIEDAGIGTDTSYDYYVCYTERGQKIEARLSNPGFGKGLEVGAEIRIRFLPEKPNIAVWIK